jgi:hypothetical protein
MWRIFIIFILVIIISVLGAPFNYKIKFPNLPAMQIGGEKCSCNAIGDERKRCPPIKCKSPGLVLKYYDSNANGSSGEHFKTELHNNTIKYNWEKGVILNSNKIDNIRLEFTGFIKAPVTGSVDFRVRSDDGIRLFIDGQPVIDKWKLQSAENYHTSPPIPMIKDEYLPFKLEWYEHGGGAVLELSWRYLGDPWKSVPSEYFFYNDGDFTAFKKSKPVPNYHFRGTQTPPNEWGNGNSIYIDRHPISCANNGLNQFNLTRPKPDQIQYKYTCLEGINAPANINKKTAANDWGGGNTIYLDRHNVDCGQNPISSFKLTRPSDKTIQYQYTCNSKKAKGDCRQANTGWNEESNQSIYLDRHNVKCGNNEVITQFNLVRNGKKKFRYDYKCCKMIN